MVEVAAAVAALLGGSTGAEEPAQEGSGCVDAGGVAAEVTGWDVCNIPEADHWDL